ncbi:acyl-CoA desaturase [Corallococcus coralloides]|nr:acyl-CoA desaturase [Corallococcus coralloides]
MRRVVKSQQLERVQHIHTVVMTALGISGVVGSVLLSVLVRPMSGAGIATFLTFFFLVGMGLTIGYHRHFTHRSYKAVTPVRVALAVLGCMAGQGPVVFWVALHRMHHEFSDREGDPHSPNLAGTSRLQRLKGLFHGYIGWTVQHPVPNANFYARDLLTDKAVMWVNRRYYVWILLGLALPAGMGFLLTGTPYGALEGLLMGGLARMFALHNIIWWITSFAHVFGTRDYRSRDLSTNNAWLALPTLGESWHNNHHGYPTAAILTFRWWQVDISGMVIAVMEKLGLVWDVSRPTAAELEARRVR